MAHNNSGTLIALSAYIIWGLFPFYFKELEQYNAFEIIAHRIIWTAVFCAVLLMVLRKTAWIQKIKNSPSIIAKLCVSSVLITANWTTYVWAVNNSQVTEASLGYFMGPIVGVGLAMVVFKEKIRPLQFVALALALLSVSLQMFLLGYLPLVSLVLAFTFVLYGSIHKSLPLESLPSLFIESIIMVPVMIIWLQFSNVASSSISFWLSDSIWFLILAGPVTLTPLYLYNLATKHVDFAKLSFMGYLTPVMIFLLAVFYYQEPMSATKFWTFMLIFMALACFSVDLIRHQNALKRTTNKQSV